MTITFHAVRTVPKAAKAAIRIVTTEQASAGVDGATAAQLKVAGFEGKEGQTHSWPEGDRVVGLVGVGDLADVDTDVIRTAGAAVARTFGRHPRVGIELPAAELSATGARQALAEGVRLGAYTFLTYKSDGEADQVGSRRCRRRQWCPQPGGPRSRLGRSPTDRPWPATSSTSPVAR